MIKEHIQNSPYFGGVYQSEEGAVRVPVNNIFSIKIPHGFEFEVYPLTSPCDFFVRGALVSHRSQLQEPERADIGFVLSGNSWPNNYFFLDMSSKNYKELFRAYLDDEIGPWQDLIQVVVRKDLLCSYVVKRDRPSEAHYRCFIGTMCHVFILDIYFNQEEKLKDERTHWVLEFLRSIRVISVAEKLNPSKNPIIDNVGRYQLSLSENRRRHWGRWSMIIPDNFITRNATDEPDKIYGVLNDGSADIMDEVAFAYDATMNLVIDPYFELDVSGLDWLDMDLRQSVAAFLSEGGVIGAHSWKAIFANDHSHLIFYQKSLQATRGTQTGPISRSSPETKLSNGRAFTAMLWIENQLVVVNMGFRLPISRQAVHLRDHETIFLQLLNTIKIHGKSVKPFSVGEQQYFDFPRVKPDDEKGCSFYARKAADKAEVEQFNEHYREMGIIRVQNVTGTDYQFIPLEGDVDDWDDEDDIERKKLYETINKVDVGSSSYHMDQMARDLAILFRVNEGVFDDKHDREAEVNERLLSDAYLFCALRSFAWTLAAYCDKSGININEVDIEIIKAVASYIEGMEWVNFTHKKYFKGLCHGKDIHNYYVPDTLPAKERKALVERGDNETTAFFAASSPLDLTPGIESLDALRQDLSDLAPVMLKIHDHLLERRDRSQALTGALADVLYAWCGFAIAADRPFFLEDGPMNYDHTRLSHRPSRTWTWTSKINEKPSPELDGLNPKAVAWFNLYEDYVTRNPEIEFEGKAFVLTGVTRAQLKQHPVVQQMLQRGGLLRDNVTGKTDYLVAQPNIDLDSRTPKAIELMKSGKPVKIVLMADFLATLAASANSEIPRPLDLSIGQGKPPQGVLISPNEIVDQGYQYQYTGSAPHIIWPKNLTEVGRSTFENNQHLRSIVIPEGVRIIRRSAFYGCSNLEWVDLPASLEIIEPFAFNGCRKLERINLPPGLKNLGESALSSCESLKHIDLPASLKTIPDGVLGFCLSLRQAIIPEGVEVVERGAFWNSPSLEYVSLPNSLTTIGDEVFWGAKKLKGLVIPPSLIHIAPKAFNFHYGYASRALMIYVTKGSYAEKYAVENFLYYEYS